MKARTPQDALSSNSGRLAPYIYEVGTKFPHHLLMDDKCDKPGYYINVIMKEAESDLRKTLRSLKRGKWLPEMKGRKLLPFHQKQLDEIRNMVTKPDSVEIAGHAPGHSLVTGNIANECYVPGVPGAASGVEWELYLLFRKMVNGNRVAYLHPYPVYCERRLVSHMKHLS